MSNLIGFGKNGHVAKSRGQHLRDAGLKIMELEKQAKDREAIVNKLTWQNAQLRVAITAIGTHYKLPQDEAKKIVDDYIAAQEAEFVKAAEEKKKQFIQDLKDGKVPEFTTVKNPDASAN